MNLLAASNPLGRFVGIDLNPAHVARADELRRRSGRANVEFRTLDFANAMLADLPAFDYIALYGVQGDRVKEVRDKVLEC